MDLTEITLHLDAIRAALGQAIASDANPTGALGYYDPGEPLPWRISDDYWTERYTAPEEAIAAARKWFSGAPRRTKGGRQ